MTLRSITLSLEGWGYSNKAPPGISLCPIGHAALTRDAALKLVWGDGNRHPQLDSPPSWIN